MNIIPPQNRRFVIVKATLAAVLLSACMKEQKVSHLKGTESADEERYFAYCPDTVNEQTFMFHFGLLGKEGFRNHEIFPLYKQKCRNEQVNACYVLGRQYFGQFIAVFDQFTKPRESSQKLLLQNWHTPGSSLNVAENFEFLAAKHQKIRAEIVRWAKVSSRQIESLATPEAFFSFLDGLRTEKSRLKSELTGLSEMDSLVLDIIETWRTKMQPAAWNVQGLQTMPECSIIGTQIRDVEQKVTSMAKSVAEMQNYITVGSPKRVFFLETVHRNLESAAIKFYTGKTKEELNSLHAELVASIRAENLGWEVAEWWYKVSAKGLGDSLDTRYFQYSEPIRILQGNLGEISRFRTLIQEASLPAPAATPLIAELGSYEKIIDQKIAQISRDGWERMFERQEAVVAAQWSLAHHYPASCSGYLKKYQEVADAGVSHLKDFLALEMLYIQIVRHCRRSAP